MAFPETRLPILTELMIDGVWVDYTSRVRSESEIRISSRGYSGEGQTALSAGRCDFTINNRDGLFSNRNPASALFGKIGKNTQVRHSITESTVSLRLADYSDGFGTYDGGRASTTDKAVLDITGDLDVRADIEPDHWRGGRGMLLVSKYVSTGNQRSWSLYIDRLGYLYFTWSTDGTTTNRLYAGSTSRVASLGRQAVRATIDVNNGAAGKTVTFYTSDTISGTWTQLGAVVTTAGTTSIFSSSAVLEIGALSSFGRGALVFAETGLTDQFAGKMYRVQVYNGIGGTLVADANFSGQAAGTTSWSDGLGTPNTWTLSASAMLSAQNFRFWGEIPDLPQQWDNTGTDVYIQTSAADLISRLQVGGKALKSPIYGNLSRFLPSSTSTGTSHTMHGWWPMEQGGAATNPTAVVGSNGVMTGGSFSSDVDFPGSSGVLTFTADTDTVQGTPAPSTTTGTVECVFYFRAPAVPAAATRLDFLSFLMGSGTTARVDIGVNNTTYHLNIYDSSGTNLVGTNSLFGSGASPDQPMAMRIQLVQSGVNVNWALTWYPVGAPVLYGISGSYVGTIGRCRDWQSQTFTGKTGWWISQIAILREDSGFNQSTFTSSTNAYVGERPDDRFGRLCRQQVIPYWIIGRQFSSGDDPVGEQMGAQTTQTFLALVQECRDVDGGQIYAPRDKFGLTLRMKSSLINREPVRLDYSTGVLSGTLTPRDDTFFVRNDVTTTRENGGQGHAVKTSGPNNVNDPTVDPQGVGTYDPGPITRNTYTDDQLQHHAGDIVLEGTWDDLRYPNIQVNLERQALTSNAALSAQIRHLDLGDVIRGVDFPSWTAPDDQDMLILGYNETLGFKKQEIIWNTKPYGPYRSINDLTTSGWSHIRAGATNSYAATAITSSALTFPVGTPAGKLWGTTAGKPGNFPMDIAMAPTGYPAGERMTLSAVATWLADTFNRSSSSSWGSTSTGSFAWTTSGGSASDYDVTGTIGRINLSTVTTSRQTSLDLDARITELRFSSFQIPSAPTGVGGSVSVQIRLGSSTDYVGLNFQAITAGGYTHWVNQRVGGVETAFDSGFPSTGVSITTAVSVLLQIASATVSGVTTFTARAKVYAATANEPSAWTTTVTMTQANAVGDITILASRNASTTNAAPYYVQFDGLTIPRIQLFTVSARSANGVVLAHAADEFVQVFDSFYVAR